jgi:predicted MFS family arabinose efflux permease
VAGLSVGLYGLAVLGWTRAVKPLARRLGAAALIFIGAGMLALGYASGAAGQSLPSVSAAAILIGGGFAFMHSTLQTWATEVVPEARATVISLFAAALFAGSGVAAMAAAPLAEAGSYGLLFALAALVAVPLGLFAGVARRRYSERRR